ncbi:hypothetical protein [Shimia sediminis]|uniref:hypothetical protein n=1 Tax=Shimia sediminis TaxID=2497945 RepID=UPI000F8C39F4|nr:hypothetical protein [Shimia sediminis]
MELLIELQSAYATQFEAAYEENLPKFQSLHPEIAFEISGTTYRKLFVVDFIGGDHDGSGAIEIVPNPEALRGPAETSIGSMQVVFSALAWDSVRIEAQPTMALPEGFDRWFNAWLDVDKVPESGQLMTGIIHSVVQEGNALTVDFGSAPPSAAFELFDLYRKDGAVTLTVSSGRHY